MICTFMYTLILLILNLYEYLKTFFFIVLIINLFIINYLKLLIFEVIIQIKHIAITLGVHTYVHTYIFFVFFGFGKFLERFSLDC